MKYKLMGVLLCLLLVTICIPVGGERDDASTSNQSTESDITGPRLGFLASPDSIGWGITIWNFGTSPAFFIQWKIETEGVNGTKVLGGNRQGTILYLRPMDSQFLLPRTLPQTRLIYPIGQGEIKITLHISCAHADFEVTETSHWMLVGANVYAMMHHW